MFKETGFFRLITSQPSKLKIAKAGLWTSRNKNSHYFSKKKPYGPCQNVKIKRTKEDLFIYCDISSLITLTIVELSISWL